MKPQDFFVQQILELSKAQRWEAARGEWDLNEIYLKSNGTCLCGKTPIVEHCVMHNRVTDETAVVGNECVKKFFQEKTDSAFRVIKTISKNPQAVVSAHIVHSAVEHGYITEFEASWYLNMRRFVKNLYYGSAQRIAAVNDTIVKFLSKHPKLAAKPPPVTEMSHEGRRMVKFGGQWYFD